MCERSVRSAGLIAMRCDEMGVVPQARVLACRRTMPDKSDARMKYAVVRV